ncbi:hypothetical protein D1AOALGA4SA_2139 [Olavius algarvensis Delta 1 endosymbiont]|nr:hypothetical protein D1AOALGA4SA_2139 [Olavius algarvensis Delta 1 endosymbiont]
MSTSLADVLETVVIYEQMLDAGYSMLDDQECSIGEFHQHPVSRKQNRESVKTGNSLHCGS